MLIKDEMKNWPNFERFCSYYVGGSARIIADPEIIDFCFSFVQLVYPDNSSVLYSVLLASSETV
jgi:hypothetical protein